MPRIGKDHRGREDSAGIQADHGYAATAGVAEARGRYSRGFAKGRGGEYAQAGNLAGSGSNQTGPQHGGTDRRGRPPGEQIQASSRLTCDSEPPKPRPGRVQGGEESVYRIN